MPFQGVTGCGGRQRNSPTGGAAKGIPLKLETPSPVTPRTIPEAVFIFGPEVGSEFWVEVCASIKNALKTNIKTDINFFILFKYLSVIPSLINCP
jgi:hypothetical protein